MIREAARLFVTFFLAAYLTYVGLLLALVALAEVYV